MLTPTRGFGNLTQNDLKVGTFKDLYSLASICVILKIKVNL